jgi:purine-binding chemotaxis protein CheW
MSPTASNSPIASGTPSGRPATAGPRQFVSFRVEDEEYAIDIMAVREIKGWTLITPLPNQPTYVLGVLNLRGAIVPIFDIRCRFGKGLTVATPMHVVIIVSVENRTIGLLVDAVSDILSIDVAEIRPVPELERAAGNEFLSGIIATTTGMVVLLDLENLFRGVVSTAASAQAA